MENKFVSEFLAENIGQLFIDFANKKITNQDNFDFYWHKIFDEAIKIEKEQIRKAYYKGVRDEWEGAGGDFKYYYNETYGKDNL